MMQSQALRFGLVLLSLAFSACANSKATRTEIPKEGKEPRESSGVAAGGGKGAAPNADAGDPPPREGGLILKLLRAENKPLLYEGSFERRQEGKNKYQETGSFYVAFTCMGREGDPAGRPLDLVTIMRTFLDRSFKETTEAGKVIDRIQPNSEDCIDLGPSFKSLGGFHCHAFDAQNNVAQFFEDIVTLKDGTVVRGKVVKAETDENRVTLETTGGREMFPQAKVEERKRINLPHVLHYETPHYFFPIFSRKPVVPGDSWTVNVSMVIPVNPGAQGGILPTQFMVKVIGKLRSLQGAGAGQVAIVDYSVAGSFDSSAEAYADRFGASFREMNRIVHSLEGVGSLSLDVTKGQILEKQEEIKVHLEGRSTQLQGPDKAPKEERNELDIFSRFRMKLLQPGTKLKNGLVVPPNQ